MSKSVTASAGDVPLCGKRRQRARATELKRIMRFQRLASSLADLTAVSRVRVSGSRTAVPRGALLNLLIGLGLPLCACTTSAPPQAEGLRFEKPPPQTVVAVDGGAVHSEPAVLRSVAPEFPKLARQQGSSGEVLLRVRVDEEGAVRWILLEKSDRRFDGAAVEAVRAWRFAPALRDGEPIAVDVLIPMRFRADG